MVSAKHRKKLFVADPAWKTIPWTGRPKPQRDHLLDLLLDIPGILEEYDKMISCANDTARGKQRNALVAQCWELDGALQSFAASVTPPIGLYDRPSPTDASTAASDEQLAEAVLKALYWSGCLLLYSTLKFAVGPENVTTLPERADYTIYIRNIAWAIRPLLDPQAGMFGQHTAVFPFAMALQFGMVAMDPRKAPTGERAMLLESLRGPGGTGISGFLLSINTDSDRHPAWMNDIPGTPGIRARAQRWVGMGDESESWKELRGEHGDACEEEPEEPPCLVHHLLHGRPRI